MLSLLPLFRDLLGEIRECAQPQVGLSRQKYNLFDLSGDFPILTGSRKTSFKCRSNLTSFSPAFFSLPFTNSGGNESVVKERERESRKQ